MIRSASVPLYGFNGHIPLHRYLYATFAAHIAFYNHQTQCQAMFRGRVLRSEGARRYDGRMTNASFSAVEPVLTALQSRVARDIVSLARRDNLKAGDHLVESTLARDIGTSRSPVNAALRYLVAVGVVAHDLNRGYFLSCDASDLANSPTSFPPSRTIRSTCASPRSAWPGPCPTRSARST